MRATDDRYRGEQAKFELAMRMIRHEARTGTIRYLTGLNDDRIRKLYTSYFKYGDEPVRRQRGRSPTRIAPLVRTPQRALESGVFTNLLLANGLLSFEHPPGPAEIRRTFEICGQGGSAEAQQRPRAGDPPNQRQRLARAVAPISAEQLVAAVAGQGDRDMLPRETREVVGGNRG